MVHGENVADEELVSRDKLDEGPALVIHAVKILNGYMNYLRRAARES